MTLTSIRPVAVNVNTGALSYDGQIPDANLPVLGPGDHGLLAWTCDPAIATSSTVPATAGRLEFARIRLPVAASITNVHLHAVTAGSSLTAGQCFAALYTSARALVGVTADQAAAWASTGQKTMALASGPYQCAAGDYYVAFWYNGTTAPAWVRASSQSPSSINIGLSSPNLRFGSADTGLTTTAPSTMGTQTTQQTAWWAGLS